MSLILECEDDDLSEAQTKAYNGFKKEQAQYTKMFEDLAAFRNAEVVASGQYVTVYQLSSFAGFPTSTTDSFQPAVTTASATVGLIKPTPTASLLASPPVSVQNISNSTTNVVYQRNSNATPIFPNQNGKYKLLVIPKATTSQPGTINVSQSVSLSVSPSNSMPINNSVSITTPKVTLSSLPAPPPLTDTSINKKSVPTTSLKTVPAKRKRIDSKIPKESSAVVDLTEDEGITTTTTTTSTTTTTTTTTAMFEVDSREISFARFPGKTYPSLMVVARPYLKTKTAVSSASKEKNVFDAQVKNILTKTPAKLTEWLLQTGLIAVELTCDVHVNADKTPIKIKLALCSDVSKFPQSGGYVRHPECCSQKFISVFKNSIFEGSPHPPAILLKLIYHWSCHTPINNLLTWIKVVDNLFVKNFFANLRAVCTAAVNEHFGKIGGPNKKVEVGVISLGTTSVDGYVKRVKIEVLGILECETKNIRLRAVDPLLSSDADKSLKTRLHHILKHLELFVHKETIILTDNTIDKSIFLQVGFKNVIQRNLDLAGTASISNLERNNTVMEYLRVIVPRLFQNTLSLLNTRFIQQFLDELSWRECFGTTSSKAFNNIILHIAEQTKIVSDLGDKLTDKLADISKDPFKNWSYNTWKKNKSVVPKQIVHMSYNNSPPSTSKTTPSPKSAVKEPTRFTKKDDASTAKQIPAPLSEKQKPGGTAKKTRDETYKYTEDRIKGVVVNSIETASWTSLDSYYYGSLPPDSVVTNKLTKVCLNMKCPACGVTYNNNIQFMEHLIGHALNEGAFTADHRCRYCLKSFTSIERLEEHTHQDHESSTLGYRCLICEEKFTQRVTLITHMHLSHNKLELPYICVICKYRCSEHKKLVDHFYDIHNDGDRVQCPLCLKVVVLENSKRKIMVNVNFFVGHIQRHQQRTSKWKCNRCVLTFVNKKFLKDHQTKDHTSMDIPGILRHLESMTSITMPPPPAIPQKKTKIGSTLPVGAYTVNYLACTIRPLKPKSTCYECSSVIQDTDHFRSCMLCMRCTYLTCCKNAMITHIDTVHENKIPPCTTKLYNENDDVLYCTCGFSSSNPDECARHLVNCMRKTLYRSAEKAANYAVQTQSAIFPPLITLDDDSSDNEDSNRTVELGADKNENSDEDNSRAPDMLSILGLKRKLHNKIDDQAQKETGDTIKVGAGTDVTETKKNEDNKTVDVNVTDSSSSQYKGTEKKDENHLFTNDEHHFTSVIDGKITENKTINLQKKKESVVDVKDAIVLKSPVMPVDESKSSDTPVDIDVKMETSEQIQSPVNGNIDVQEEQPEMDVDKSEEIAANIDVPILDVISP